MFPNPTTVVDQAHQQIDESSANSLQTLFDLSLDIIAIITTEGRCIKANPIFTNITGYTLDQLYSGNISDFIHPDDKAKTTEEFIKLAQGLVTISFENRLVCKDGSIKWIAWRTRPQGNFGYVVGRDITEQKKLQQLQLEQSAAESRKREAFIRGLCHRLYNPLHGISGTVELLDATIKSLTLLIDDTSTITESAFKEKVSAILNEQLTLTATLAASIQEQTSVVNEVLIPIGQDKALNNVKDSQDEKEIEIDKKVLKVLIVDDSSVNRLILKKMLTNDGHTCVEAVNGQVAIDTFIAAYNEGKPFDIIFMDVVMPIIDGNKATRAIRSFESSQSILPGGKLLMRTRIIGISANDLETDKETSLAAGMNDYLVKPCKKDDIVRMVNKTYLQVISPSQICISQFSTSTSSLNVPISRRVATADKATQWNDSVAFNRNALSANLLSFKLQASRSSPVFSGTVQVKKSGEETPMSALKFPN